MNKEQIAKLIYSCSTEEQIHQAATALLTLFNREHEIIIAKNKVLMEMVDRQWVSVEEDLPKVVDKNMKPVLALIGKRQVIAFYFPDKFKTVEWEDWDDYKPEWFPWTTEDKEKEVVWLNAGFYAIESCSVCDNEVWGKPLPVTHWQPLPPPISTPSQNKI